MSDAIEDRNTARNTATLQQNRAKSNSVRCCTCAPLLARALHVSFVSSIMRLHQCCNGTRFSQLKKAWKTLSNQELPYAFKGPKGFYKGLSIHLTDVTSTLQTIAPLHMHQYDAGSRSTVPAHHHNTSNGQSGSCLLETSVITSGV